MKVFSLALLFLMGTAGAGAQSLGDLARQEEARRKAIAARGKVYTNDSLKAEPPSSSQPAPSAPAASGQPSAPPSPSLAQGQAKPEPKAAAPTDETKTEDYWRKRLADARESLSRARIFADALQTRINTLSNDFVNRDDPAQRNVISSDRQKAIAELERVRKEIAQHQKSLDDIQEEARKAGIPPGWLR